MPMLTRLLPLALLIVLAAVAIPQDHTTAQTDIACQEDLTGETIRFYHFGDLSSVYTFLTLPVVAGFEDAVDYFNAQGGICGATIAMEYDDTGASQERAQALWETYTERDDIHVVFLYQTEDAELLREQAAEARIPIVVSTGSVLGLYGEDGDDPGWVFAITPLYEDQLGAFCAYISANWDTLGIEGDPVIGHVSWLGAFGESSDQPQSRAYCESLGIGYAGAQYYFPGLPDISVQVQNVLDNGANILYTTSVSDGPARLASTAAAMDLAVNEEVLLAGPNWVLDSPIIGLAGQATNGMIGQLPYRWWDEIEHPGVQVVTQYWLQNRLGTGEDALSERTIAYMIAWGAVDLYRQVVVDTINQVGYENFDGAAVYDALTSGTTYVGLDGVLAISFSETRRAPNMTRIGQIQFMDTDQGLQPRIVPLTDWFEMPDLRPGGADVPAE